MSRRRRREEEEPDLDSYDYVPVPSSKRRRRRWQPPATVATLAAADVGHVDDVKTGRGGGGSATVLVSGLPPGCAVLELKSRLEMYGAISRIRIDGDESLGFVTFRSPDSARAAISASVDPACGITVGARRVQVALVGDHVSQRQADPGFSAPSKLLRAEVPLRKHGRGNKKISEGMMTCDRSGPEIPCKGRQIVAYDDLL